MKKLKHITKWVSCLAIVGLLACSWGTNTITINDTRGTLGQTNAPVSINVELSKKQKDAAKEGRLGITEISAHSNLTTPVQVEKSKNDVGSKITFLMPKGKAGTRKFELVIVDSPFEKGMKAELDSKTGQIIVSGNNQKILQYNYKKVYEKDVVRSKYFQPTTSKYSPVGGVYLEKYYKAHPNVKRDSTVTTQIYAVPRSDYIHPLYGLNGEMLTRDWPDTGHPHHRGIFWAWPEVIYGSKLGDIYALQRVFARPTGNIKYTGGSVFAQVVAENLWVWEKEPIVNEFAVIRVYKADKDSRIIDLTIKLDALKDSVTIATRNTNSYGGLNVRLQSPKSQNISYFTDKKDAKPLRAWSDFSGVFNGSDNKSGLMILQHKSNPEYPGEWREYRNLAWVQPTFPSPNTRYPLSKEKPLILHYRLIIHKGGRPGKKISQESWDAYNNILTPVFTFDLNNN